MASFRADCHIHTCLSPCGSRKMLPEEIVKVGLSRKLDVIGICDHNSAENVEVIKKVGSKYGIVVIGGMEITSKEEVHIIVLFDDLESLEKMQDMVYKNLPGKNREETYGYQCIVDEEGYVTGINDHLLIGATSLCVEEIIDCTHKFGGLAIAAHIDRDSFSVIGQLGFIDKNMEFDAVEVSYRCNIKEFLTKDDIKVAGVLNYSVVSFSDAHEIPAIGRSYTIFNCDSPTIKDFKKSLEMKSFRVLHEDINV